MIKSLKQYLSLRPRLVEKKEEIIDIFHISKFTNTPEHDVYGNRLPDSTFSKTLQLAEEVRTTQTTKSL